nr:2-oxo acid dehydrogenase subunit E2 [Chloroflexia bacterium]
MSPPSPLFHAWERGLFFSAPICPSFVYPGRAQVRYEKSRTRRTIAARLAESQHSAAMLTTFDEVDMAAVTELRKRRRDAFKAHSPELHKCTLMFIVMNVRWGEYAKHLLG